MKKKIAFIIAAIFAMGSLDAQPAEPQQPVKTGDEWKMPGDVVKRSQHFADSLKKALTLDDATTKKVFDVYMANTKPVDEIRITTPDEKTRKEKLKANHEAFNEKLRSILSADQFKKYLSADKKR